ncbi:MAG: hypothetical protein EZS28_017854 [Streblomastix strix]|uniref:U-box domain-containing protein n=1 Tax=Streblomastix strix TaxID=222440 RepID=A0A5J4VVZ0_9EUKA|nr:MAG: hypothetical protein EZS28_017854 [Streblomastix strix]
MTDPVSLNGHYYERSKIIEYIQGEGVSPVTYEATTISEIKEEPDLKAEIERYLLDNPQRRDIKYGQEIVHQEQQHEISQVQQQQMIPQTIPPLITPIVEEEEDDQDEEDEEQEQDDEEEGTKPSLQSSNTDDTIPCDSCQLNIPVSQYQAHQDTHFRLRSQYDGQRQQPVIILAQPPFIEPPSSINSQSSDLESTVPCESCQLPIPFSQFEAHFQDHQRDIDNARENQQKLNKITQSKQIDQQKEITDINVNTQAVIKTAHDQEKQMQSSLLQTASTSEPAYSGVQIPCDKCKKLVPFQQYEAHTQEHKIEIGNLRALLRLTNKNTLNNDGDQKKTNSETVTISGTTIKYASDEDKSRSSQQQEKVDITKKNQVELHVANSETISTSEVHSENSDSQNK